MELRQLRYFVAVAEELHFARAAQRLGITSPTLSQQVKCLERDLGVPLFVRSSVRVGLTPAGEQLLGHARTTLADAAELEECARRLVRGQASTLRVGFVSFALTAPARRLLTDYARAEPGVDLQIRQFEWDDPSAGLLEGTTDVALVRPPFTGLGRLRTVEVARDAMYVVVAEDHPVAARDGVRARQLARLPFLEIALVQDRVFADFWYLRGLRGPGAPAVPSRAVTVEEWLGEIALGRGIDLVPGGMVETYRKPGLAFVPVVDLEAPPVVLAWDPGHESEAVRRFVDLASREPAPI